MLSKWIDLREIVDRIFNDGWLMIWQLDDF